MQVNTGQCLFYFTIQRAAALKYESELPGEPADTLRIPATGYPNKYHSLDNDVVECRTNPCDVVILLCTSVITDKVFMKCSVGVITGKVYKRYSAGVITEKVKCCNGV